MAFLFFLPGFLFAEATILDSKGSFLCDGTKILRVKKGKTSEITVANFLKLQDGQWKKLKKQLAAASKKQKAKIKIKIKANRALREKGIACGNGSFQPQGPLSIIRPLALGQSHSCAITPSPEGAVYCWGRGDSGQLGDGNGGNSSTAVKVSGISRAVAIAAGRSHTCVVLESGSVSCWGDNYNGQFGSGTTSNTPAKAPVTVSGVSDAADIASGESHLCILTKSGGMRCWGRNDSGQVGVGSTTTPLPVSTPQGLGSGLATISAGYFNSCAMTSSGALHCFGWNRDGQLGSASPSNVTTPVAISSLGNSVTGSAGGYITNCALSVGQVFCSGRGNLGQLGVLNSTSSTTQFVQSTAVPSGVAQLVYGRDTGYARLQSGSVMSWGANDKGQLGGGVTGGSISSAAGAVTVTNLAPAVTFVAGNELHACAVIQGGEVRCWGDNAFGQLGNGATNNSGVGTPVTVLGLVAAQ